MPQRGTTLSISHQGMVTTMADILMWLIGCMPILGGLAMLLIDARSWARKLNKFRALRAVPDDLVDAFHRDV